MMARTESRVRTQDFLAGQGQAVGAALFLDLGRNVLFDLAPVAIKRRDQLAIGGRGPAGLLPGGAAGILGDIRRVVLQAGEERLPFVADAGGLLLPLGIEFLDIVGVTAVEE